MKFLINLKEFSIPSGSKIFEYVNDLTNEEIFSPDDTKRSLLDWCEYISTASSNINKISLDINEFSVVVLNSILNNPRIGFFNDKLANAIGFTNSLMYLYNPAIGNGMNIYSDHWGLSRYVLEDLDNRENYIGTDGNIFQPHTVDGGWTISGRSYRPKNKINTVFWKLTTDGLTIKQGKEAVRFFENLGSNVDLEMKPFCFDVFDKLIFQVLAHKEYLKPDDIVGYYKVEFELSERLGSGLLTLNDDATYITKNDDITFLTRS